LKQKDKKDKKPDGVERYLVSKELGVEQEALRVKRTEYFVSALAADPRNVKLWIEYAESSERDSRNVARSAIVERKLAIFERALREV
jgi:hypothetical protein